MFLEIKKMHRLREGGGGVGRGKKIKAKISLY
jgi:hypothetical protein